MAKNGVLQRMVLIGMFLLACGCATEIPEEAFDDPMAHPTIAFAEEVDRGQGEGELHLLTSEAATLWTLYSVENEDLDSAFEDIFGQASQAGWVLSPPHFAGMPSESGRTRYDGNRDGTPFRLRIIVNNDRDRPETHHSVSITLRSGGL